MLMPTVNIGTIRGGVKVNTIPSYCAFETDIRLPIGLTKESVLEKIDQILKDFPEASYLVQEAATNPTTSSPRDHELVGLIQSHAENVRGKRPLPISSLGATDCKHFRRNGVPAYAFGVSPETMAEKDERVSVEEFLHIVKVHTLVALDYLGALGSSAR
jgi:acetylornithine deacetylase/succinyl-diaminopimelate desuccinylase-like protein